MRRVLKALARQRDVVEVALDRFFRRETVEEIAGIVVEVARAQKDGQFTVGAVPRSAGQRQKGRDRDPRVLRRPRLDAAARRPAPHQPAPP